MGIAFRQTEINIKIARKQGKEISKLLKDKGWITEEMPLDAALAAVGWHGKSHRTLLIIEEIDVDKITERVSQQLEALAPFVRDGSFVRFESEESSKDYALCIFEGGKAHGYGWLGTREKTSVVAAIGDVPSGPWNEYIHDESPSREKLTDYRYWAVVAWNMAQNIQFIAQNSTSFSAKDKKQAYWIIRACEEAQASMLGKRHLIFEDIKMYDKEAGKIPQVLASTAHEAKLLWLKGPRKKLAELEFDISADELQALLRYRDTFAPGKDLLVDGREGIYQPDVLAFFEYLREASWFQQLCRLAKDGDKRMEVILDFQGLMSDVMESADLKELLFNLHWSASADKGSAAIVPGVSSEEISSYVASEIHNAMQRVSQLVATK
ncbi:Uncharacterised protein [Delftia tsuruhatensis]|uniref:hypothetical protein n=1 Tax=Delftia tsuruhatensis TaxID=180282 RepID=UPI001E7C933A|nr:hypothetical protein [Delftia tsuruhatensis]CAB5707435.1 Uncharacterised protein [Delftia tsuruhatensis]CAC9684895.1 Uncharacterised protein [Delftia tsuruhatensis]